MWAFSGTRLLRRQNCPVYVVADLVSVGRFGLEKFIEY
jgi:hypothetical protein